MLSRLWTGAALVGLLLAAACSDTVEPDPGPRRSIELTLQKAELDVGTSATFVVVVFDGEGAVIDAGTEWVVRDSAVAEVFGYESSESGAPVIYASAAGRTWVVVTSETAVDSIEVVVTEGAPLGINEAMIEVDGHWTRRYRVPVWQGLLRDGLLDPREVGTASFQGAVGPIPEFDTDEITDGFWVWLPEDSLDVGTRTLGEPGSGAPMAYVFVRAAWWYQYGPHGPNNQIYLSGPRSTFTIDSVERRPDAGPILHGALVMESATEYRAEIFDTHLRYEDTGRRSDIRVDFVAEVAIEPISEAVIDVTRGPLLVTDSAEYAYLFSAGDSVRTNFHFWEFDDFDFDLFLQVRHDDYTEGSYTLGADEQGTRLHGRWGPLNSRDELSFLASSGTFEITERREVQGGYPPILRGTLEATGPLMDSAGVAVDTLGFRLEFAVADSLEFELDLLYSP